MSDLAPTDDDDLFAAEYALGSLGGADRGRAERRMRTDLAFAGLVAEWEGRLAPMLSAIEPVPPPEGLWDAIDTDLRRIARVGASLAARPAAGESAGPGRGRQVSGLWRWLGLGSFGLLAASLAALAVVARSPAPPLPAEPLAAMLAGEAGPPLYTAVVYPGAPSATLVPVTAGADPAHSHELWLIAPDAKPRSLGLLKPAGPFQIRITPELLSSGRVLAISLEPVGGSPTGQPTGPVVATGALGVI